MSRTRACLFAALAGILITTGGCTDSATAPSAGAGPSLNRVKGDSVSTTSRPAGGTQGPKGDGGGGEVSTLQSGYIGAGS
jgi:hypothetical protein